MSPAMPAALERFYPPRARERSRLGRIAGRVAALLVLAATPLWAAVEWACERLGRRRRAGAGSGEVPAPPAELTDETLVAADPYVALALSLVPGAGHLFIARSPKGLSFGCEDGARVEPACGAARRRGLAALAAAVPLLVWVLLFPPAAGARWLFMAVFGLHQWVMADAYLVALDRLESPRPSGAQRVKLSLLALGLLSAVYAGAGAALGGFGTVLRVSGSELAPLLEPGDRLWIASSRSFAPGELVYSRFHGGIERVLAGPGDLVATENGRLFVNGVPAAFRPASNRILESPALSGAKLRVPDGSYCVLFPARHGWLFKNDLLARFMIPKGRITGRVSLKYWPSPEAF